MACIHYLYDLTGINLITYFSDCFISPSLTNFLCLKLLFLMLVMLLMDITHFRHISLMEMDHFGSIPASIELSISPFMGLPGFLLSFGIHFYVLESPI